MKNNQKNNKSALKNSSFNLMKDYEVLSRGDPSEELEETKIL